MKTKETDYHSFIDAAPLSLKLSEAECIELGKKFENLEKYPLASVSTMAGELYMKFGDFSKICWEKWFHSPNSDPDHQVLEGQIHFVGYKHEDGNHYPEYRFGIIK